MTRLPEPLTGLRSIKLKWSIVILAAVAVTAATSQLGLYLGWPIWVRPIVAASLALIAVQILARGMTFPLREMARSAQKIAEGDYTQQVQTQSKDEIGQLASLFNDMAAQIAAVDRRQKEFAANASHELRTPVAVLRGQLENIVDHVTEPDGETLQTMLAQAEHLSVLVHQLLDLSRLEATSLGRELGLTATGVLIKQVAHEAQLLHPGAQIDVHLDGPLGLQADERLLHQLLTNVVANALRFSPLGSPVTIDAKGLDHHVEITISDGGPGIPPHIRGRVFEPFWQADGSAPTGGGGAGLGLAICKRITELHGGEIQIISNQHGPHQNNGVSVRITLPTGG